MTGTLAAGLLVCLALPRAGAAEPPQLDARVLCQPAPAVGRVRCDVELAPPSGARLDWADALVVESPEFARPLRSRVRAVRRESGEGLRVPLALLATQTGRGTLRVRARAVLCAQQDDAARCRATTRDLAIELRVGVE